MHPRLRLLTVPAASAALALSLGGCASLPGGKPASAQGAMPPAAAAPTAAAAPAAAPAAASAAASGVRPATPAAQPPAPGQPQPFANVIKDAKKIDGLFTLWQKDDKVWLELKPEDFDKPFFFAPKIARGIGERGLFGGMTVGTWGRAGRQQIVSFKRVHNQVQMVAHNTQFVAPRATPEGRAVEAGFSPSLLASSTMASQAHPERKSVLVEANPLFFGDLLALGAQLQQAYRQNYGLDPRHTSFSAVRGKPDAVVFEVSAHYATAALATPQPGTPPGAPVPTTPASLPDARSLFFGLHYSIAKLPDVPMAPRAADPRVGYFSTPVTDFTDDLTRTPRKHFVNRWRLEKKDPAAALSEPVKPITFWLDRTIPLKYRDPITRGILAWNAAFEKIGFKDAIQVKVQPEDADFDTLDVGVPSVRWMTNAQPLFGAIGPSQVDPRTGEILDADIGFESLSSRNIRAARAQIVGGKPVLDWPALMQQGSEQRLAELMAQRAAGVEACTHADQAAEQLSYALDVLEARGELEPDSPEAEQWVRDYLTDTTMHEVGHTLGLRHNFRSSQVYTAAQMADPEFTRKNGLAGSVMEYAPINLAAPGAPAPAAFQLNLGPYDYWAIEYAYKPMPPGSTAAQEAAELQRIAARSSEPMLAYGTDEDNSLGIDPETLHMDLGNDPVAFAARRFAIARDLIQRQSTRALRPDRDYAVLRRSVNFALRDAARAAGIVTRQIAGVRTLRDFPGSGRDPLQPVPAAAQRAALDLLVKNLLAADALVVPPALQRRMAPDYMERTDAVFAGDTPPATDFAPAAMLLDMQRALLTHLMSDGVAQRLLDSRGKFERERDALGLGEVYRRIDDAIWSELDAKGADIVASRRDLQREHLNRVASVLVRPSAMSRADARSLLRSDARKLLARLDGAMARKGLSDEARAHLEDSAQTLRQALTAGLQRAGV